MVFAAWCYLIATALAVLIPWQEQRLFRLVPEGLLSVVWVASVLLSSASAFRLVFGVLVR